MKRIFPCIGIVGCMALVLIASEQTAQAVRDGLLLCAQSVIPALFPFFVLSGLFASLGYAQWIGTAFHPTLGRLFACSSAGTSAFLLGMIGGYPVGGRTVGQLYRSDHCSAREAEHLLAFCNNAGPAFIFGIAGNCFSDSRCGWSLYLIHISSAILTGLLLGRSHARADAAGSEPFVPFSTAFVRSVQDSAVAMVQLCGFLVFFLVILRLLTAALSLGHPLILGFVELTCGILHLPPTREGFIWGAALLGWGGLSVHCQTAALLSGTSLSLRRYLLGKAVHSALSAAIAIPVSGWIFL